MEPFEIFISGYAKLPMGTTAEELYKVIAVGILVDKNTGEILDADCTLVTSVAKNLVNKLLVGKNILRFEEIEKAINERYFGTVKKSLISSIKKCHDKLKIILEEGPVEV
ncbi:DUF3870 domain-containing protein [Alkaliphilus oremlandii]|uniref:DUF3870 domain-containing protein n=1 Tax=Alkaliphilus oremlandii (strain OhILAs) TaxID=350688 RepID=A8MLS9_ALKOO|nr:DUF3870 domain-containing protein [Alkaliphilus oremlandii]ABW17996.1 conserved hypothetical protein [Alkaliphilus oremlandii OhILAs]